jgi:hypothetical protein
MQKSANTITWITRTTKQMRVGSVSSVTILHRRGVREAGHISLVVEDGLYRYHISLERGSDRRFHGTCKKFSSDSERFIEATSLSCCLLDSLEEQALLLGLTPWVEDDQQLSDWMGQFTQVERVICQADGP